MILIDMKMPSNCVECPLADKDDSEECPIYAINKYDYPLKRFICCPLKEAERKESK